MAHHCTMSRDPEPDRSLTDAVSRWLGQAAFFRLVAAILLVAQFGLVAHRIEHYIAPDHVECGDDACAAFAPTTGGAAPPPFLPPLLLVVFFIRFWTLRPCDERSPAHRIGFRAHAPPL